MNVPAKLPDVIASRYRPIRLIATGGMGVVYEAQHTVTGEHLALKILTSSIDGPGALTRFRHEARASALIKSEHVARVIDADIAPELGGTPFLVMELLEGSDLERAATVSPPTPATAVEWLRQVAPAIDKAHRLGIVHRDLKPENLFLTTRGDGSPLVKVLDFGIVKMIEDVAVVTGSGQILGTPCYMAPEQASANARVTPAIDRCAVGLIAYRLLLGRSYYQGSAMGILAQLGHAELEPPSRRGSPFGTAFDDWFLKACHRSPERRFASTVEQIEALAAAVAPDTATQERPRRTAGDLFGREHELGRIEEALVRARSGSGSLLLVTGEAGIGKSRIARELGAQAVAGGTRVVWGRCWEVGGATPYWPWVQVFRELGMKFLERHVREPGGDAQQQRFHLFDRAARDLIGRARKEPLAIVLDDLHAADVPSLLFLLFVARQLSGAPLVVLGTAREIEAHLSPDVVEILTKIAREGVIMSLRRLTFGDVATWVTRRAPLETSADKVFRLSEGNPLFIEELLRLGPRGKPLFQHGITVVLDEHLGKLPPETRATLEVAAVLGREFGARELAATAGLESEVTLARLAVACPLGVLEDQGDGRFQFTHLLLRDRLYEGLEERRRQELHWRAGLVAETQGVEASTVAHHLVRGAGAGDREWAASNALHAAEVALGRLAFEVAASIAKGGLELLGQAPSRLACRLRIAAGEALIRAGFAEMGRPLCVQAADTAKRLGAVEEFGLAALAYGSELTRVTVDPTMVRLLEEALVALGNRGTLLGAKLGARLTSALSPPRSEAEAERTMELARQAMATARQLGDEETLLYVLVFAVSAFGHLSTSTERFEIGREMVGLAQRLDQPLTLLSVGPSYAVSLLERGRRAEANDCLALLIRLASATDHSQARSQLPMLRASFATFDGRLDEAERLGDESLALAAVSGAKAAEVSWAQQRVALALARGDGSSIVPVAARALAAFERVPLLLPYRAWVLTAVGRRAEAAAQIREVAVDPWGFRALVVAASVCVALEDRESGGRIYEYLARPSFAGRFFWGPGGAFAIGPTPRVLGDLARLLGDFGKARRHYRESIELCERVGATFFLQLSSAALAISSQDSTLGGGPDSE
jgi:tetratricopeptide (TPR) repeat protein